ncbi:MAG: hypothetical protein J0M29_13390 [Chitinophagales bacterium]|nr:hypothetical protein [Chitinophagales bacterium]MDX1913009.1 hypothetical protein [Saprospiraceae bacterium]
MKKNLPAIIFAALFTISVLILGYILLGLLPMFLFAFGFLGGFIIWLAIPSTTLFETVKVPYFVTLLFFILHKIEERYFEFFPALSKITGVPVPETNSLPVYLLYAFAGAWLLIPSLVGRRLQFGYYLAWTFFTSMGVTELAHFIFPFFTQEPYGYFPGMASVFFLAPLAWWGMYSLSRKGLID